VTHGELARLARGGRSPWLIPYCASCKEAVERLTFHPITEDGQIAIEVQCHGKTTGLIVTENDINRMNYTKQPIKVFEAPLQHLVDVVIEA
jgi:hypothetical protein